MKYILLISCLFFSLTINAQVGSIKGKVTDKKTGDLLLYANISVYKDGLVIIGGQTDFDGNYQIDSIKVGVYSIEASYVGYEKGRIEGLKIFEGKTIEVNIEMVLKEFDPYFICFFWNHPIIELDNTIQGQVLDAEQIEKLPTKNINDMIWTQRSGN